MIDDVDLKILGMLCRNAKTPVRDIAKAVGVSIGTVHNKIKKLEKEGYIRSYTANVDWNKLGYSITAVIELVVSGGKLLEIEKKVSEFSNVVSVYDVTGESDVIILAKFRSHEELSTFTKTLLSIQNVDRTNTHIVLTILKESECLVG
ncbi:MAG: Lrp/AsnC family transcriptional regulator [Nitrososphaeria archaeon]|nr:Lrp/AsnC family transcriptional regulator [Conexivisphaerales archaeon]